MPKRRLYGKEALENAVKFVQENSGSIRAAAKQFGVPRSSIQFKLRNPTTKFKSGPDTVLTEAEENSLCNFIIQLAKRGFPRKKEDIKRCVEDFLKANPRPNPFRNGKPGDVWFKGFLNRHTNISSRSSEGVTNSSAFVSERDIRKWFGEIEEYFIEENLLDVVKDPSRVFNADETGFNICPKTGKVFAERGCKNVYEVEKGSSKENITVLFTFSAAGFVCDPLIIYPFKRIPDRITLSVPSGWGIGRSDSGWMTADVFYDFIGNCFYQQILANNISLPVILFVDGHKTHLTIEVSELCRSLQIHLIALYPNATRILQPADVAAFRPIKIGWKKALREWYAANNYQGNLTKENFAPLLKTVVESCTKTKTLVNGFRVCGLYPFDPNNVDYSKCIAQTATNVSEDELATPNTEDAVANTDDGLCMLSYTDFCIVVGKSIVNKCVKVTTNFPQEADENFIAIYKLWKKFHETPGSYLNIEAPTLCDETSAVEQNIQSSRQSCDYGLSESENQNNDSILDEMTGEFKQKEIIKDNEDVMCDGNDNSDDLRHMVTTLSGTDPQPTHKMDPNKKITVLSNVSLSEYLKTKAMPEPPKRQGKRQIEKTPFALTSDSYIEKIKSKQLKKQEEEKAKEERKRLREEKKSQKENVPKKKPKKEVKEKNGVKKLKIVEKEVSTERTGIRLPKPKLAICCDSCLSPIVRKVNECSQCCKKFHLNCIPQRHRIHIPEDDDAFLCHNCYKESNTDSSDDDDLFCLVSKEAKKQGF